MAGLFQRIGRFLRKSTAAFDWITEHASWKLIGGRTADLVSAYRQSPWVYAGARALGRNMAGLPFLIKTGSREQKTQGQNLPGSHELVRLFARPSPMMPVTEMWESIPIDFALYGEWIWLKLNRMGKPALLHEMPAELHRIHPRAATHIVDQRTGLISHWQLSVKSRDYGTVPAESVIHHRLYNPDNPYRGLAGIEAAKQGIALDYKADAYTNALLDNDCTPGGILKSEQELSQEQADVSRAKWSDNFKGARKKGGVAVLPKGMEWIATAQTSKDMAMPSQRERSIQEIRAALGVTELEMGDHGEMNLASSKTAAWWMWKNTMIPMIHAVEDALWAQLFRPISLTAGQEFWGVFDLANVEALSADLGDKMTVATQLLDAGYTLNQVNERLMLGMPKVAWGDEAPTTETATGAVVIADGPAAAGAAITIGDGSNKPRAGGTAPAVVVGGGAVAVRAMQARARLSAATGPTRSSLSTVPPTLFQTKSVMPKAKSRRVLRHWHRKATGTIGNALAKFYKQVRKESLAAAHGTGRKGVDGPVNHPRFETGEEGPPLPPLTPAELERVLGTPARWRELARSWVREPFNQVALSAVRNAGQVLGGFDVIELSDPRWLAAAAQRTAQMVRLSTSWRLQIRDRVLAAVNSDTDPLALADAIQREFGHVIRSNGMVVARTEAGMIGSQVRAEVWKAEGIEETEWSAAGDAHTRPSHAAIDGERRKTGERFSNGLLYPLEPGGPPEEVIQCRCSALPVA